MKLTLSLLLAMTSAAHAGSPTFTLQEVLDYPMMTNLVADPQHDRIAWVQNDHGARNVWVAEGPTFAPRQLTPYDHDDGQELTHLVFAPDGHHLLYVRGGDHEANWPAEGNLPPNPAASTQQPTVAIWSVVLSGGTPVKIASGDAPQVSNQGIVAFLKQGQVWTTTLEGHSEPERLFFDAGHDRDLTWSPDGRALAFVSDRSDHGFIGIYTSKDQPIRFLSPSSGSDESPSWSSDSRSIAFARVQTFGARPQPALDPTPVPWSIWVAEVAGGEARRVWQGPLSSEGSFPVNDGGPNLHWAQGDRLVFRADLDGWSHLYSIPACGGEPLALTPGPFIVESFVATPDGHSLIYSANTGATAGDHDRRHLFIVPADRPTPKALTTGEGIESLPVMTSSARVAFIHTDARHPTSVGTVAVSGGAQKAINDPLPQDFPASQLVVPQPITFQTADGLTVHGQIFRSSQGSTTPKPAILFLHGGPFRQMLLGWHPMAVYSDHYAVNQYLATHGYIVLSVNYRLGVGYGHAFEYPQHAGPYGAAEYQDVLAAARALVSMPGVDPKRIGIWGSSYGGYLSALALARNSDLFKAGVDIYGVTDLSAFVGRDLEAPAPRFEDFGRAGLLKSAFAASPVASISTWRSPVLIVHGDDDRNVPVTQSFDLIDRLNTAGVPHDELILPNETHSFLLHQSAARVDQAVVRFFAGHL